MAILTFKGGIHPHTQKEYTKDLPIEDYTPIGELVFPVIQHYGAPCEPVVSPGDRVRAGDLLAQAMEFYSSNVFASVSGVVKAIEDRKSVTGQNIRSVIVQPDGSGEMCEPWLIKPFEELKPEEIRFMIQWAGVVGLGGRTIPTHTKLDPL